MGTLLLAAQEWSWAWCWWLGGHPIETDFLRASTDGRVEVLGRPRRQGRTHQLWLVTITDGQGRELARGQVRLQNVDRDRAR